MDPGDLGPLQAETAHQAALVEEEGVDALVDGGGGERGGHSLIDDDEARAAADFPTAAAVEIPECRVVHHEQRVAEFLNPGLKSVGGGGGLVG